MDQSNGVVFGKRIVVQLLGDKPKLRTINCLVFMTFNNGFCLEIELFYHIFV